MKDNENNDALTNVAKDKDREPYGLLTLAGLAGPFIWVLHFALAYLAEGFVCMQPEPSHSMVIWQVVGATLVMGALCLCLVLWPQNWVALMGGKRIHKHSAGFLAAVTRWLAGLALLAILWSGTGVLLLGPCQTNY